MANYFPSITTPKATGSPSFDPSDDCVIIEQQRKKKQGIKDKPRPLRINVVMLKKFTSVLPKGRIRKQLASSGQIQTMRVYREMSSVEIRTKILKAFEVSQYTVLESDGTGNGLLKASEQDIDGMYAAERRGCLYLCQSFEVSSYTVTDLSDNGFYFRIHAAKSLQKEVPSRTSRCSYDSRWCTLRCRSICVYI